MKIHRLSSKLNFTLCFILSEMNIKTPFIALPIFFMNYSIAVTQTGSFYTALIFAANICINWSINKSIKNVSLMQKYHDLDYIC